MTMTDTIDRAVVDRAVDYHGSLCPGLAVGIQAARLALREIGHAGEDNSIIAVAETDICAVDAIQAIVGTTLGNRNLIVHDWGKNAFTFFRAGDGKAVRISARPAWASDYQALRLKVTAGQATADELARFGEANAAEVDRILGMQPEELYEIQVVDAESPGTSQVDAWITCDRCGELVLESRTASHHGESLCVPCYDRRRAERPMRRRRPEAMAGV
jgi:formylmethanofuran dehydrogenase subunit E